MTLYVRAIVARVGMFTPHGKIMSVRFLIYEDRYLIGIDDGHEVIYYDFDDNIQITSLGIHKKSEKWLKTYDLLSA